jgi:hypothetical protein
VDGGALYALCCFSQLVESRRDLFGGFVGEGEGDDTIWRDAMRFDDEAYPLDETECLSRARTRDDKQRSRVGLDGGALGGCRSVGHSQQV